MTIREIKRLEQKVYEYETKLNGSLQKLAAAASLVLGYDVVADLCNGNEIEFRVFGDKDVSDTDSCIRINEILTQITNPTQKSL